MSPTQYRALEALEAADWIGVRIGETNDLPSTIHRGTAEALARRGLAVIIEVEAGGRRVDPYAKITTAGVALLATNPVVR